MRWAVTDWHDGHVPGRSYHLLHSKDDGRTWSEVTPPQPIAPQDLRTTYIYAYGAVGEPDEAWALFVGPRQPTELIWHTTDGGQTWRASAFESKGNLWGGALWMDVPPHSDQGWLIANYFLGAGSSDGSVHRTYDGGATWETLVRRQGSPLAAVLGIDALDSNVAWVVTGGGPGVIPPYEFHRTSDGGLTWEDFELGASTFPVEGASDCDVSDPHLDSSLVGRITRQCTLSDGSSQSFVGTTSDGGETWRYRRVPGPPIFLLDRLAWAVAPPETFGTPGAAPTSTVFFSKDGGRTFQAIGQIPQVDGVGFPGFDRGWAIKDGTLLTSHNGGITWAPKESFLASPEPAMDVTDWTEIPGNLADLEAANTARVKLLAGLQAPQATSLAASPYSVYAGTQNGKVIDWHWDDPRVVTDGLPRIRVSGNWIYEVDANPGELGFFAAGRDGSAYASGDLQVPNLGVMNPGSGELSGVARIGDGVLTSGADGKIRYWFPPPDSGPNWAVQWTLDAGQGWVWDVASAPDGDTFASAGAIGNVKLWSLSSRRVLATLRGHQSAVTRVRFSPDGSSLASASRDGTVRVWDVPSGQLRFVLNASAEWVTDVAYSPSGGLLATVGGDGMATLWDAANGDQLRSWRAHAGAAHAVIFRPDGKILVTVGDDGLMRLWGVEN
jgi:WD40 repeat protein